MLWGLYCSACHRRFQTGDPSKPCRACGGRVLGLGSAFADGFSDDEFPYHPPPGAAQAESPTAVPGLIAPVRRIDVPAEVRRIATLLERHLEASKVGHAESTTMAWRIVQRCPICEIELAVSFYVSEQLTGDALFGRLFALYDEHRCLVSPGMVDELRARADRESARMAERAGAIKQRELAEPPRGTPSLYERAEREAVLLAEWALAFEHPR